MKNLQRYLICFIIGILLYYLVNTIYKCNIERLNIGGPKEEEEEEEEEKVAELANWLAELMYEAEDEEESDYPIPDFTDNIDLDRIEVKGSNLIYKKENGDIIELNNRKRINEKDGSIGYIDIFYSNPDPKTNSLPIAVVIKFYKESVPDNKKLHELNITRKLNKLGDEICNTIKSRVITYTEKQDVEENYVIMEYMNGNMLDFLNHPVYFKEWRDGVAETRMAHIGKVPKIKEDIVFNLAKVISKNLQCLNNLGYVYTDLKFDNILYKLIKLTPESETADIKIVLGDLEAIYNIHDIVLFPPKESIVEWKERKGMKYTGKIFNGEVRRIENTVYSIRRFKKDPRSRYIEVDLVDLTLIGYPFNPFYPLPEVKFKSATTGKTRLYTNSEDLMVWGFGVILLLLLGINEHFFYFKSMHEYAKTVGEYYDLIIKKINELEIENETLKDIIDKIFKRDRDIDLNAIVSVLHDD